jgi:hypothetical protein
MRPSARPRRHNTAVVTVALFVASLLTGCSIFGNDDDKTTEPQPTLGYPRSWIWSTAAGIPLNSPYATAVRAWVESADLHQDTRVSYPGFRQATATELFNGLSGADSPNKIGGTDRILIRSLVVTGNELRARFCADSWDTFYFNGTDGSFFGAGIALSTHEFVMRKADASASSSMSAASLSRASLTAAQTEPSPNPGRLVPHDTWLKGPTTNVFGGWVATTWEGKADTPPDCIAWFKRSHPGLNYPTGYTAEQRPNRPTAPPPPTLPASPGW